MSQDKPISLGSLLSSGKLKSSSIEDIEDFEFDGEFVQSPKPIIESKNKPVKSKVSQKEVKDTKKINYDSFKDDKYSGFALYNFDYTELPKLVDPIFPEVGLVSLVGSSDTGKSTFLRQLALTIALKIDNFVGYPVNAKSPNIIYISTEDDPISTSIGVKKQTEGLTKLLKINLENLNHIKFIFDGDDLDSDSIENRLENILENTDVQLVIVDAFTDLFAYDINSSTAVRNFFKQFSKLAKKYKCLILFLHHTGKGKDKVSASKDNVLGSQAFEAKMRVLLELRRHPNNENLRTLTITKGNYISSQVKKFTKILSFDESTLLFSSVSDILTEDLSKLSRNIKNSDLVKDLVLNYHKEGKSTREIESLLKEKGHSIGKSTVNNYIRQNTPKTPSIIE